MTPQQYKNEQLWPKVSALKAFIALIETAVDRYEPENNYACRNRATVQHLCTEMAKLCVDLKVSMKTYAFREHHQ